MSKWGALAISESIEIIHPLFHIPFEASLNGMVETLAAHLRGEIVLPRKAGGCVVIVDVSFSVTHFFHQGCGGVEDGSRGFEMACFFSSFSSGPVSCIDGVALGGKG